MPEDTLSSILAGARSAHDRLDTSRPELAFETRMQAIVRETRQDPGPATTFQTWLRATMGLATATGLAAFIFMTSRPAATAEDALTAWWTDNAAAWDDQLFN